MWALRITYRENSAPRYCLCGKDALFIVNGHLSCGLPVDAFGRCTNQK